MNLCMSPILLALLLGAATGAVAGGESIAVNGISWPLYPATMEKAPDIPSPFTTADGMVVVVGFLEEDRTWSIIPVTVENGKQFNYKKGLIGKGNQLEVDGADFPTLARTGLHSEEELAQTKRITGLTVEEITARGRPEQFSSAGFMGRGEEIIGVLTRDNRLVKTMGLTHPQLARELFRLWNIILLQDLRMREVGRPLPFFDWFFYRGRTIRILDASSGKGWQESIFDDGILGMYHLEFARDLDPGEKDYLQERYPLLDEAQRALLVQRLTTVHTGEMVPYYIQRYGFYEGDSSFRADPLALAFIFGLRSIEQLDAAFAGKLHELLTGNAAGPASSQAPDE